MEVDVQKTCIVCEQAREQGMTVVSAFICTDCEREMVRTSTEDEKYPFFVRQLRQLWVSYDT